MRNNTFRKYTPEEVLNIFLEEHRLCSPLDPEADPDIELSGMSSVGEWRDALDLTSWDRLYRFLNECFEVDIPRSEWKEALEPENEKTLWDVAFLISKYGEKEVVRPVKIFGDYCMSAAVFLTLKNDLRKKQVPVKFLKPSSSVVPYLNEYPLEMIEVILKTGVKVFDELKRKRKKKGFLNFINIFDPDRYTFDTGEVKTFRHITERIVKGKF